MMTVTLAQVAQVFGAGVGLIAFAKMCWHIAEFAISAKGDIKSLTVTLQKLEKNIDEGMVEIRGRLLALETKEAVRTATEHLKDMEERS